MIIRTLLAAFTLGPLAWIPVFAQSYPVTGTVIDQRDQAPLPGATVLLVRGVDSIRSGAVANAEGRFTVSNVRPGTYAVRVSFLGFHSFEKRITVANQPLNLGPISLNPTSTQLNEVKVVGKLPTGIQNGDTTQFNAGAFKTNPDASAEDLIQKMPGMDLSDGVIKAQGETVTKVLVDGKPFFGDDPNAALRNLPAEIIDQIQVYDQKSEQAQFTGFDDGQTSKTINIITKANKRQGQFGKLSAGYGPDDRYQASGTVNIFRGPRRVSVLAQSNNINVQNFSNQDLSGVGGSGGRRGGRGGAGRGRESSGGGEVSDFLVGQQSGISTTHAGGVNYSDQWGKKVELTGSYFANRNDNRASQLTFRDYVLPADSGQTYRENSFSSGRNDPHRVNLRLEYRIDSANSLLIRPAFSSQTNRGVSALFGQTDAGDAPLNQTRNDFFSNLRTYRFSNNLLFRHRFRKPRRTFSFHLTTGYNRYRGKNDLWAATSFYGRSVQSDTLRQASDLVKNGWAWSGNASYTEPIGQNSLLQLTYQASFRPDESRKSTYDFPDETGWYGVLDTTLSNAFESRYFSQQAGAGYRYQIGKLSFSSGINYQRAQLRNDQVLPRTLVLSRAFLNVLPRATFRYQFSARQTLNVTYRTATDPPTVDQLQNVLDNTNPLQLSTGNPNLRQSYQHHLVVRYAAANSEKSRTSFALLSGDYANDYVANSTFIARADTVVNGDVPLRKGTQLYRPVNLDWYWALRSLVTHGIPVELIRSNLNLNASFNHTRRPGLINDEVNYVHSQTLGLGVVVSSNVSEKIDFTLSTTSAFNFTVHTLRSDANTRYYSQSSRLRFNWLFGKGWVAQTGLNHQLYTGLSRGYNQNYWRWNASLGKKFLKNQRGEVRAAVYDLLNQNNSIDRTVTASYLEDVRTQVLRRYFLLTFTYTLRNFKR